MGREAGTSHALAVLIEVDDGPDRIDFGGSIHLAIAGPERVESRRSRIYGGRDWVRLGAVELALDCLRRYLYGLPVTERADFERVLSRFVLELAWRGLRPDKNIRSGGEVNRRVSELVV